MRKTILAVVLAALAAGILLAGCKGKEPALNPDEPTPIVIWHYYNGTQKEAFDELVGLFNETVGEEKGIVVTAENKGNVDELAAAVLDSADKKVGSDDLPDVFATYVDTAYILNQNGLLVDLKAYLTEEELAEYVPAFLEEGELTQGQLQVFPVAKSTELFYLNETDWEAFSRETGAAKEQFETWEGLAEVAKNYYEWSGGKAFFGRDAAANYLLVGSRQLGEEIFTEADGQLQCRLDETVMRRLWDGYAVPYLKGYYGAYGRFRSDDVKTGDLIACVGSTSSTSYYPTEVTLEDGSTYPIEGEVYLLPDFEGTESYAVQQGAGMAVTVSDKLHELAAVEFLKWFTDVEQNTDFCVSTGYIPVKKAANTEENMKAALEKAGIPEGSLTYRSTLLGVEAVSRVNLYTNRPFEGAVAARGILSEYMTDKLDEYRSQIDGLEGSDLEAALDGCFRQWVEGLQADLKK